MSDPTEPVEPAGPADDRSGDASYSPRDALSYGWRKFSESPSTLLIPMIVVFVGIVIVALLVEILLLGTFFASHDCTRTSIGTQVQTECGPNLVVRLVGAGVAAAVLTLVAQVLAAGLYKGATHVTDGRPFVLGEMFDGWDKAQVVIASLVIAAATFVGTIVFIVPGIVVGFLTQYVLLFIVDKQLSAMEAIRASVTLVSRNLGSTSTYYLLAIIVLLVGAVLCGIGVLVAAPVALIGLAYTYRRLQGEPVVP